MNITPLLIVPAIVCLFWIFVHWFLAARTLTFRVLVLLFSFIILSILGDVGLSPLLDSDALAHIAVVFATPCLIPLTCLYFLYLYRPFEYRPRYLLWIILPVVLTTATVILTVIMGVDETDELLARVHSGSFSVNDPTNSTLHRLYYFWSVLLFQIVTSLEMAFMLGFIITLCFKLHLRPAIFSFLFRGKNIRVLQIQIFLASSIFLVICLKMLLHASTFHENPFWALSFSTVHTVLYFLFGFFALFSAQEYLSLSDIPTALRFNYKPSTRSQVAEEIITEMSGYLSGESLTHVLSRLNSQHGVAPGREAEARQGTSLSAAVLNVVSLSSDESGLAAQFRQLLQQERLYLQPGLTLGDVAERLHTNKTYVSKMVNQTYKMGFPELLNILRVDYAQRYIRNHPDVSQEEIAKACGFVSASSFNSTFKRISGFTPKVWLARKDSISGR